MVNKTRRGFRPLHFPNGSIILYRIYKSCIILYKEGKRVVIRMTDFTGMSNYDLERANWKGYWPKITPQMVKDYILTL